MEGAPDAKRSRLDHELAAYPSSVPPLRPATTPAAVAPTHQYTDHPPSAPPAHSYTPPTTAPLPAHQSAQPGAPPYSREPVPDPRGHPQYHPPTSQPGFHEARPGYGSVNHAQPRSFSTGSPSSRPTTAPAQPPVSEQQRGPAPPAGSHDRHTPMEHGVHPPVYPPMDPHVNGAIPNGLPYPQQPEQYAVGPVGPHQGYPPTPVAAYAPANAFHPGPTNYSGITRRKQVRATQACNNCRQRKQKCDEARPCGYCKNEALDCEYREVPPPKTDRTMLQLLEQQKNTERVVERNLEAQNERILRLEEMVTKILRAVTGQTESVRPGVPYAQPHAHVDYAAVPGETNVESAISLVKSASGAVSVVHLTQQPELEDQQDQAPLSHETGAQYLMNWPMIESFFSKAGVTRKEYVQEEEEKQGTLRPFGRSFRPEETAALMADVTAASPGHSVQSSVPSCSPPAEGLWGVEYGRFQIDQPEPSVGGLLSDGSLCLDEETVLRLWDSYMRNMWIMHPFIDAKWLKDAVDNFIRTHSPTNKPTKSPGFAVPTLPRKRKHSSNTGDGSHSPGTPEARIWKRPRAHPERSIENGIVLLILALGRVLEEDGFLLQEYRGMPLIAPLTFAPPGFDSSPRDFSRPSPPRSHANLGSVSSPTIDMARGSVHNRGSPAAGHLMPDRRTTTYIEHTDIYPGLAYFGYATDILGNNHGGTGVIHAQAFLLAGLYLGQMGRALESWAWIQDGCRVTTLLRTKNADDLSDPVQVYDALPRPVLNDECTIISFLCWSALQLESDLRAELDTLPKPGQLMFTEPRTRRPGHLVGLSDDDKFLLPYSQSINGEAVMWHYITQIQLRLTLNRVHTALYVRNSDSDHRIMRATTVWADADASQLFQALQSHRHLLDKQGHMWKDGENPPTDLLEARLRAKYYGAAYIILRPYVFNALRWQADGGMGIRVPFSVHDWLAKHEAQDAAHQAAGDHFSQRELPKKEISVQDVQDNHEIANIFLWCCKKCIDAAIYSTIAFDGVANPKQGRRMRVTNIHGTATAQFSNMLVLVAVCKSWLAPLVRKEIVIELMERTIVLHQKLRPLAPVFQTNLRILQYANEELLGISTMDVKPPVAYARWQGSPVSMHGSHGSQGSMNSPAGTPRGYATPGPISAHSSFSGSH